MRGCEREAACEQRAGGQQARARRAGGSGAPAGQLRQRARRHGTGAQALRPDSRRRLDANIEPALPLLPELPGLPLLLTLLPRTMAAARYRPPQPGRVAHNSQFTIK